MTRWKLMRKVGGYGAAVAVMPYFLIKIAWTFGLLLPNEDMGDPLWRAINATTALLALVGIVLAMALTRPWGERLPAWSVLLPAWVGIGLLVPMVLLAPMLGPAAVLADRAAGATTTWSIEQVFVLVSLIGTGVGLPVAFAGYAKARWPEALGGPIERDELPGQNRQLQVTLARLVVTGCVLLGVTKAFWALGGTVGIDPTQLADRDLWWRLLTLSTGVWSLAGAWGVLVLARRRGCRSIAPPVMIGWVSSGMLFAYNMFSAMRADSQSGPEYRLAWVVSTETGVVLGLVMVLVILLILHDRRQASGGSREVGTRSVSPAAGA